MTFCYLGNWRTACLLGALVYLLLGVAPGDGRKFRVCVVDGRGSFKKTGKYCPILDRPDSKVECVIGVDRLDCLRKISKNTADFSVFTPEDLVTATNSQVEVLITNEMRLNNDTQEYEVVAVVSEAAGITSRYDLRDKRLCHPGYGYETDWTRVLSNYFEASVVPQTCEPSISLTENRIRASSEYFKSACKAGPWVSDPYLDRQLKMKYPNLCALCNTPNKCSNTDKYWGRRGPLYCLTDAIGDVSWARLDDVYSHFGISTSTRAASPRGFKLLCPDGELLPIDSPRPCSWVVRPWTVVGARRTSAEKIQQFISTLSHTVEESWQNALLTLIENYHYDISTINPIEAIESFLAKSDGFLSANSFSGCHPPRTIKICTTSNLENAKCGWLREAANVYGIEPDIDCILADSKSQCMTSVADKISDVVFIEPDMYHIATSKYNLKTLLYETVNDNDKYITMAVVKNDSKLNNFEDLKGLRASFPSYNGVTWHSVVHALHSRNLLGKCPYEEGLADYFGPSCVPNLPGNLPENLKAGCEPDAVEGDRRALKRLVDGEADVAFMSGTTLDRILKGRTQDKWAIKLKSENFKVLCHKNSKPCHLSWTTSGQAMVRANVSDLWFKETLDAFMQIDNLFGKNFKSLTNSFTLYGLFDRVSNVLFHDSTQSLRNVPFTNKKDHMIRNFDEILNSIPKCSIQNSGASLMNYSRVTILLLASMFVIRL